MNMTTDPSDAGGSSRPTELQFDQADYAGGAEPPPGAICAACNRVIPDVYFEAGGQILCATCREKVGALARGGSRVGRVLRALVAGVAMAGLGAGLYYGVAAISGYEIGLVAIVLGALVGGAVRWGARRRGGAFYQCLAVLLTYLSVGASYSIFAIRAYAQQQHELAATQPAPASAPATQAGTAAGADDAAAQVPNPQEALWALVMLLGFVFWLLAALPVLASIESPMGFLIIGIALYQAWRMNKRVQVEVTGPYAVAVARPPSAPEPGSEQASG
jgi:hypothetical protein